MNNLKNESGMGGRNVFQDGIVFREKPIQEALFLGGKGGSEAVSWANTSVSV
jgi:hypothetical protein